MRNNIGITKQTEWIVPCEECGKERKYKYCQHYYRALNNNKRCKSCALRHRVAKEETLLKRRLRKAKMYGGISYNPTACQIFEEINKELKWNGIHAENGGEKIIEGYLVDYYEPNLNIVIEYDEPHHEKKSRKIKDKLRQKRIINSIHCKFYRIKEGQDWRKIIYENS